MKRELLPKHERYLDAFSRFLFLRPEHLQKLFGPAINERTLRWDLAKMADTGLLGRARNSKDEPYTYFPRCVREKSPLKLEHENEVTWTQILFTGGTGFNLLACERRSTRIRFAASIQKDDGTVKVRRCIPDFLSAHRSIGDSTDLRCYFWEITRAKPGQHWRKENDIIQKCRMYNAYFESGDFVDRFQKEFQLEVRNFRVIITFPTEARARNFIDIFRRKSLAYPGRFWITWEDAYRKDMYGKIFLSPKDDSLVSFID